MKDMDIAVLEKKLMVVFDALIDSDNIPNTFLDDAND